jgi:hypothetical protein
VSPDLLGVADPLEKSAQLPCAKYAVIKLHIIEDFNLKF